MLSGTSEVGLAGTGYLIPGNTVFLWVVCMNPDNRRWSIFTFLGGVRFTVGVVSSISVDQLGNLLTSPFNPILVEAYGGLFDNNRGVDESHGVSRRPTPRFGVGGVYLRGLLDVL